MCQTSDVGDMRRDVVKDAVCTTILVCMFGVRTASARSCISEYLPSIRVRHVKHGRSSGEEVELVAEYLHVIEWLMSLEPGHTQYFRTVVLRFVSLMQ